MTETPSEISLASWQVPECRFLIEYSLPILDEIRRISVDAFFSLPRGGAEIGGILFGAHGDDTVRIQAYRPMACEHAFGPGFVLSDKDKAQLTAQFDELRRDPGLRGMEVVGWYHSHTRSEIFLSDADLNVYREFFPEPWQIALVLRPSGMKPTRAGFFFRAADGSIHSEASYHEFIAGAHPAPHSAAPAPRPVNGKPAVVPIAPATVPAPAEPVSVPAPAVPSAQAEKIIPAVGDDETHPVAITQSEASVEPETAVAPLPPANALLPYTDTVPARRPPEINPPIEMRPAEFVPPAFLAPPQSRRSRRWIWVSLVAILSFAATAYFTSSSWLTLLERKPINMHLQALDYSGQLGIQWDHETLAALNLAGGALEITDGSSKTSVPLDPVKIRSGSFQYLRRSEMVEVHLSVRLTNGRTLEEFTSFIGQKPSRRVSTDQPEKDQQSAETAAAAEKARADLKKEQLRTMELEQALKRMQSTQRLEEERRRAQNQVPSNSPPANPSSTDSKAPPRSAPQTTPVAGSTTANNSTPAGNTQTPAPVNTPARPLPTPPATPSPAQERPALSPPKPVATAERAPIPTPAPAAKPPTASAQPSLSGSWVFSPASKTGSPFPPETVTLAMTEAYGQVRGLFVGRYRVPKSRKFSPSVRFSFEGPVQPGSSKFPFTAADGMKGEIELIRLPNKQDAIEVVWHSERDKLTFDDIFFRKP